MSDTAEKNMVAPVSTARIGWLSLIIACVVTAMCAIGVSMWLMRDVGSAGASGRQHLVFVDTQRIIDAKVLELASKKLPDEESAAEGRKFAARLQAIVGDFQEKGFTVVNAGVLLADPDGNDLTAQVAGLLGVQLDVRGLNNGTDTAK